MVEARCTKCGAQLDIDDDDCDGFEPLCSTCIFVKTHCKECGCKVDEGSTEFDPFDGAVMCHDCFCDNYGTCEECENIFPVGKLTAVHKHRLSSSYSRIDDEVLVCEGCLSDYRMCVDCGLWHEDGRSTYIERTQDYVCDRCREEDYFTCDRCGEIFRNDDYGDDGRCLSCNADAHRNDDVEEADIREVINVNRSVGTIVFKHDPDVDRILADPKSEL